MGHRFPSAGLAALYRGAQAGNGYIEVQAICCSTPRNVRRSGRRQKSEGHRHPEARTAPVVSLGGAAGRAVDRTIHQATEQGQPGKRANSVRAVEKETRNRRAASTGTNGAAKS